MLLKRCSITFDYIINTINLKLLKDKLTLTTSNYKQQQKRNKNKNFNNNAKNLSSSYKVLKRQIVNNLLIFVIIII